MPTGSGDVEQLQLLGLNQEQYDAFNSGKFELTQIPEVSPPAALA